MRKLCISFLMALCFCAFTNKAMGQTVATWNIGNSGYNSNVTATLTGSGNNLTLTISGSGDMVDFLASGDQGNYKAGCAPWHSYGTYPDYRTRIKTVVINDGVTNIGDVAFYGCTNLTSVKIAETVTQIGVGAFEDCSSLSSIEIPSCVEKIEGGAFYNCSSLVTVTSYSSKGTGTRQYVPTFVYNAYTDNLHHSKESPFGGTVPSGVKLRVLPEVLSYYQSTSGNTTGTGSGTRLYWGNSFGTVEIIVDGELDAENQYSWQEISGSVAPIGNRCSNDCKVYKVKLYNGAKYNFKLTPSSALDTKFDLYNSSGTSISANYSNQGAGSTDMIEYKQIDYPYIYVKVYGNASYGNFTLAVARALSQVTGVTAVQTGCSVNVSWNAVPGATSYNLYRCVGTDFLYGTYEFLTTVTGTSTTDTSPVNGRNSYVVHAHNGTNGSPTVNLYYDKESYDYLTFALSGPSGVTATQSGSAINISWNSVANAIGYKVYRSNTSSWTDDMLITTVTGTSTTDALPLCGYNYYIVTTVYGSCESGYNGYKSVNYSLSAPTSVKAEQKNASSATVTVSWNSVSGATSYKVYRSDSYGGNYSLINTVTATNTSATDTSPLIGYNYYKVTAVNSSCESNYSSYVYLNNNRPAAIETPEVKEISIYPNPAKDEIFIQSEQPIEKVEISNISGQIVLSTNSTTVNISHLPQSIYFIRITVDGKSIIKKIIVKK